MITWRWQVLWNAVCFALQENCFSSLLFQTLQQWCLLQSPQGNPPFKAGVFYYGKCKKHCARTFHHVTRQNCLVQDEHRDIAKTSTWGQYSTCIHTAFCTWIAVNWVEMFCTTLHWKRIRDAGKCCWHHRFIGMAIQNDKKKKKYKRYCPSATIN